jgi:hypothetical protein
MKLGAASPTLSGIRKAAGKILVGAAATRPRAAHAAAATARRAGRGNCASAPAPILRHRARLFSGTFSGTAKGSARTDAGVQSIGSAVVDVTPGDDFELITPTPGDVVDECASLQITKLIPGPRT